GCGVPVFMPVVITAIVAMMLSREDSAPLAYIAGSLGTLIGADLTNLDKVRGLGAPIASIGGAGTFDGIFLTGILAVLLASLYARPRAVVRWRGRCRPPAAPRPCGRGGTRPRAPWRAVSQSGSAWRPR